MIPARMPAAAIAPRRMLPATPVTEPNCMRPGGWIVTMVLALAFAPMPALAWGVEGHRITAYIAQSLLTARAQARLEAILPGVDLAEIALYMDRRKDALARRPGYERSREWHYDDIPVCGAAEDVCPTGDCASAKLREYTARLHPGHAPEARAEAFRFVVHILGDVHQPLHVADHGDRGGNDRWVRLPGADEPVRLHVAWDVFLVRAAMRGADEASFARSLLASHRDGIAAMGQGDAAAWIRESHALAVERVYGALPGFTCGEASDVTGAIDLPASYVEDAEAVIRLQLLRAGVRIARVLEAALEP